MSKTGKKKETEASGQIGETCFSSSQSQLRQLKQYGS